MHLNNVLMPMMTLGLLACSGNSSKNDGPDDAGPDYDASYPASSKARVKFKGNDRLRNEFARALELEQDQVCTEFGLYSCTHLVHQVALGGTEPYGLGLNEPLPFTTITTPLAVDRLALTACRSRVDLDLETPSAALIYKGDLDDADGSDVGNSIDILYKRALIRKPAPEETDHLRQLHRDIEALGEGSTARSWAIASCFAVSTTMEQLFY